MLRKEMRPLGLAKGKRVKILNKTQSNLMVGMNFFLSELKEKSTLLVEVEDMENHEVAIVRWKNNEKVSIIEPVKSVIKNVKYDKRLERFCFIVENFNNPPKAIVWEDHKKHAVVFDENRDDEAPKLKREVIRYQDSEGTSLKGTLYYPAHYNRHRKYPMVVRIYQVQSDEAAQYLTPGYSNPVGFDIRSLMERGYFVFLPDIVFSKKGTGWSALDCVHKALDAVLKNQSVDAARVALIGHSHGGYETNFIATHSDRFATYISGAGNSDIVRSYFSYNYNFNSPFYWQYENGQYEMNVSFAQDKDLYIKNNPIYHVEKVNAPILLWAGKKDENIAWESGHGVFYRFEKKS